MRVVDERFEQQLQCLGRAIVGGQMSRQRQTGAPVLRVGVDEALAQLGKAFWSAHRRIRGFEPRERQIGTLRRRLDHALPYRGGLGRLPLLATDVTKTQESRRIAGVQIRGGLETASRLGVIQSV